MGFLLTIQSILVVIDYHSEITETDKVSTFMGLDDYDTLFAAKHGTGALDLVPNIAKMKDIVTTRYNNPYGWACID